VKDEVKGEVVPAAAQSRASTSVWTPAWWRERQTAGGSDVLPTVRCGMARKAAPSAPVEARTWKGGRDEAAPRRGRSGHASQRRCGRAVVEWTGSTGAGELLGGGVVKMQQWRFGCRGEVPGLQRRVVEEPWVVARPPGCFHVASRRTARAPAG
jgi:hypothetical protein